VKKTYKAAPLRQSALEADLDLSAGTIKCNMLRCARSKGRGSGGQSERRSSAIRRKPNWPDYSSAPGASITASADLRGPPLRTGKHGRPRRRLYAINLGALDNADPAELAKCSRDACRRAPRQMGIGADRDPAPLIPGSQFPDVRFDMS